MLFLKLMMRNISKILGLLLLLPLFTGCNDSDDVAAIFTGKTWKLNYITVDGGHDMFPFLFQTILSPLKSPLDIKVYVGSPFFFLPQNPNSPI